MKKNIFVALSVAMLGFTACSEDTMDYINKDTLHPQPEVVPAKLQLSEAIMRTGFSTVSGVTRSSGRPLQRSTTFGVARMAT